MTIDYGSLSVVPFEILPFVRLVQTLSESIVWTDMCPHMQNVLDMLSEASQYVSAPIVLFTYFNPIMARGLKKFCADLRAAGGSGLLVPDIPLEETGTIREALNAEGLELVLLTTPTTGPLRFFCAH